MNPRGINKKSLIRKKNQCMSLVFGIVKRPPWDVAVVGDDANADDCLKLEKVKIVIKIGDSGLRVSAFVSSKDVKVEK